MPDDRPPPLAPVTTTPVGDGCHPRAPPPAAPPPPQRPPPPRPRRWPGALLRSARAALGTRTRDAGWDVGASETRRGAPRRTAAPWPPPLAGTPTPPQPAFFRAPAGGGPQAAPAPGHAGSQGRRGRGRLPHRAPHPAS